MLPRIHPDRMQIAFDDHCAPASSLFYWNRAWPVRLPLPISPCVNARAHRFGGFGLNLRYLRNQLVGLERPDAPIPEQIALLYSDLREIRSIAPEWIGDRIGAMFADKTFALALGSAVGSVLVAALK